jgi:Rha family phage regulatory protein
MKTELVHRENNKAFTDSLIVAKEFNKRPAYVHEKIKAFLNSENDELRKFGLQTFVQSSYVDETNKVREKFDITEDGFLELAMSFTGEKSRIIRTRFIKAFRDALDEINKLYANPPRQGIIQEKRDTHGLMMNALIEFRSEQGKETKPVHYMSENKLCNGVVTGDYSRAYEAAMTNEQIILVALVRRRNESYLMAGLDYQERKKRLLKFVMQHNTKKIEQCI